MSLLRKPDGLTLEEYVQGELHSEMRHEYVAGQVYAMASAGERHNRIAGNVFFQLRSSARGGPCGVFMSDIKVRVDSFDVCYYPDGVLVCDSGDDDEYLKHRPCLILEVLSASTEATDRREKWAAYQTIPQLRYYLLADSRHRRMEYYARNTDGEWETATLDPGEVLEVVCDDYRCSLTLADTYEDVVFKEASDD
jgi:Uma2 family endonuclease